MILLVVIEKFATPSYYNYVNFKKISYFTFFVGLILFNIKEFLQLHGS